MIVRVRNGNFVVKSRSNIERVVELVIAGTLAAEPGDARVFSSVDADRVIGRVADYTVAVRTDGHGARVEEFAESPLGQRRTGRSEHFKPLL